MCRVAVEEGVAPEDVLVMASLHGARAHRLLDRGAIAPGYVADLVLLDDLSSFGVSLVLKDGRAPSYPAAVDVALTDTMRSVPVSFALPATGRVRVIGIRPGQLITDSLAEDFDGRLGAGLAKIAVIERHHATGRVGLGLVRGFGLHAGAFASTVAHDAHNLVVVGVNDADMALCAARAQELGGGLVVARDGELRGELALPIAGLLSAAPLEEVAEGLEALQDLLREQGVEIDAPFMTLSFLALSVIPSLKITDRGLVDVDAFALVPLALGIALEREEFVARFGALYESSPWVAETAWRPEGFADADALDAALQSAMYGAPPARQLELIRAHPDLGERVAPLTDASRSEQAGAGLDQLSQAEYDRFMQINAIYRERFEIPFVVCVREHTKQSILENAALRLSNTREQELATALGEIAKIARLRLEDTL
jgi:adenine deaminase